MKLQKLSEYRAKIAKLTEINRALMQRVEHGLDLHGNAYHLFQAAILLDRMVRDRTRELEDTPDVPSPLIVDGIVYLAVMNAPSTYESPEPHPDITALSSIGSSHEVRNSAFTSRSIV